MRRLIHYSSIVNPNHILPVFTGFAGTANRGWRGGHGKGLGFLLATVGVVAMGLMGCGGTEPLTEIFVAVNTDLTIPAELDTVEMEIHRPPAAPLGPYVSLIDPVKRFSVSLPVTLGVRGRGSADKVIEVVARGRRRDTVRIEQRAELSFVAGEVRLLCLQLNRSCVGVTCDEASTCRNGSCQAKELDVQELPIFIEGQPVQCGNAPPDLDGGSDAATDSSIGG